MNSNVRNILLKRYIPPLKRIKGRFNRFLDELLPRRHFEAANWIGPATLTIVCDDGPKTDIEKVVLVLEEQRVPGVFAITNTLIGQAGYMDAADLKTLQSSGHEIASHMYRHTSLDSFSPPHLKNEISKAKSGLEELLPGKPVQSLIFPHGYNSRTIRKMVQSEFVCGVSAWLGLNVGAFNRYAIRRMPFGSYTRKGENQLQSYLDLIDAAIASKAWLVLMIHSHSEEHDASQTDCLRKLIIYARAKGVAFATLSDAMTRLDEASLQKNAAISVGAES